MGSVGRRKGTDMGAVYQGLGANYKPHELQPVGEKLTESVPQPCSFLCTTNRDFNISIR